MTFCDKQRGATEHVMSTAEARETGTVKWFNDAKGYGFIQAKGRDYFVHFTDIRADGHRTLTEQQAVEFTPEQTEKGRKAVDVVAV